MVFKDRSDAGRKLADLLAKDKKIIREKGALSIFSLLRGGAVVGFEIAKKLSIPHHPLIVKKITAPFNQELAIGAICQDEFFLDQQLIKNLGLTKKEIEKQIDQALRIEKEYQNKYARFLERRNFNEKNVILVDDGVATGSSVKVAEKYFRNQGVEKVYLASPVASKDFEGKIFDRVFFLFQDPYLTAISSYYYDFHQVTEEEIYKIFAY